jgi:hypothetical protein
LRGTNQSSIRLAKSTRGAADYLRKDYTFKEQTQGNESVFIAKEVTLIAASHKRFTA